MTRALGSRKNTGLWFHGTRRNVFGKQRRMGHGHGVTGARKIQESCESVRPNHAPFEPIIGLTTKGQSVVCDNGWKGTHF